MSRIKATMIFLFVCAISAGVQAQDQIIEYGDTSELKGVTKIFIDTRGDADLRKMIGLEIHKKLPKLEIVSKPEESDVHLRFYYEKEPYSTSTPYPYPYPHPYPIPSTGYVMAPVSLVEKVISKDRIRVLMGSKGYRTRVISWRRPESQFVGNFVKAYTEANANSSL
ncbi:MAG: hypothetical protein L0220_32180 [Acidobacteria bacterium]|nr:hypothetical protein [Acidobacteriota bacterium]